MLRLYLLLPRLKRCLTLALVLAFTANVWPSAPVHDIGIASLSGDDNAPPAQVRGKTLDHPFTLQNKPQHGHTGLARFEGPPLALVVSVRPLAGPVAPVDRAAHRPVHEGRGFKLPDKTGPPVA